MNILQAMGDPALFGPFFTGDTWRPWKACLASLLALPMDDDALALYRHHTGRQTAPTRPFKEAAIICGRRGGKSRVMATLATFLAVTTDVTPFLAPGEFATVAVIAVDRRQAMVLFKYILGLLHDVALLQPLIAQETSESVELTNRVTIEVHTASLRSTRGRSYLAVILDECAFLRSEDSNANPDIAILNAIRPGLSTIPNSILIMASSPYAKRGALYQAFKRHYGRDDARALVWRGTTAEMNPGIDPAIIAEALEDDPAAAAAEYMAQFRGDVAAFVTREVVDAATVTDRFELAPVAGLKYTGFVDPSGGSSDSMTIAVAHRGDGGVAVLDAVREVRPPFSPEGVVMDFAALLRSYGLNTVTGDRYAGEWPRERFAVHGIGYQLSDRTKSEIYRDLLPALNSGKIELLDLPRLGAQLTSLERRTARGGRDQIDHAPGAHDDLVNAAAGALLAASGKSSGSYSVVPLSY